MKQYTGKGYTIYKHTNRINGKCYIGQTRCEDLTRRWTGGHGYEGCSHMYKAIQKYGWENFTHEILVTGLTLDEANCLEREFIALYRSNEPRFGYNIRSGGHHAGELSEEGRQRVSIRFSGENAPCGRKIVVFDLQGLKVAEFPTITAAAKFLGCGVPTLSSHCKKREGTVMNHICRYKSDVGNAVALEKDEIYKPNDQRKRCKKVVQYALDGTMIRKFNSVKEASCGTGALTSEIIACAKGKALSANGYMWRYEDTAGEKIAPYKYPNGRKGTGGYSIRAVAKYDRDTGEKIAEYPSLKEAAEAIGTNITNIHQAVSGVNPTCRGYIWRYLDEQIERIAI